MVDPELGLTVVFNGCIYNYRELREDLIKAGYRFFSHSDTEVIGKAYHRWGAACVEHFYGMFAIAVAERDTGTVMLARDRLGIKPLYLASRATGCGSPPRCPRCFAAGELDTSIDPVALHHYLSFHSVVPAPRTILAGVRKLPPATVRTIRADGTSSQHRYWSGQPRPPRRARRHERPRTGRRRCWPRCAGRCGGGWWPTCRSACCSPAASTPA